MKRAWKAVLAGLFVAAMAMPAMAAETTGTDTLDGFALENPLTSSNFGLGGTNGWTYTPITSDPNTGLPLVQDVAIVDNGIDGKSIRISNAYTDANFYNWLYSQRLANPVTESADGNEFVAEFKFTSTSANYQPGVQVDVSPQSGGGDRMSFLRFRDSNDGAGGIDVYFAEATDNGGFSAQTLIANNLSRTVAHDIKIVLDLYTGPHNDVANVFIDGQGPLVPGTGGEFTGFFAPVDNPATANKVKAGQSVPMKWKFESAAPTTWEDFYRVRDNETKAVDSLIIQARSNGGTCSPDCTGGGFLLDNVKLSSVDEPTLSLTGGPVDASFYGTPIFRSVTGPCEGIDELDPLETAAAPGASHLTYDAATGIWHYNWQTNKSMATGGCVKLTMIATGAEAIFKITK